MAWRLAYLGLLLVRLYFTLSPSYIHPDEHFQGPQVIAGDVFAWNVSKTWEFTGDAPIRSVLPLWLAYGIPLTIVRWIYGSLVNPALAYYCLRIFFFVVSFCLQDWAIQELGQSPKQRAHFLILTASSYVTWTYQTHTFSNSVETVLLLWCLVLMKKIFPSSLSSRRASWSPQFWNCCLLGALVSIGIFNRITFPAFLVLPAVWSLGRFAKSPLFVLYVLLSFTVMTLIAIRIDTAYYASHASVVTPLNNFAYNFQSSNLAKHGLHARYTHVLINLPLLLGPYLFFIRPQISIQFLSALSGIIVLSAFQHQEARFIVPAVPLLLTAVHVPQRILASRRTTNIVVAAVLAFNLALAALFGVYHQGGVVPVQATYIAPRISSISHAVWWKTYSPPDWLLGGHDNACLAHKGGIENSEQLAMILANARSCAHGLNLWDVMGSDLTVVENLLASLAESQNQGHVLLVAPISCSGLYVLETRKSINLTLQYVHGRHVNLDDLGYDANEAEYHHHRDDLTLWDKVIEFGRQNRPGLGIWKVEHV
ncbi:Alg9-like mannosyltransferase family-domain-containing protein [Lipomyces japonicus]|uniref:Alg9-like mannosyltransferase family-domain-containing protein n=1 Tax=Lipomyces japonicus TaxID=56871 RepID=UPI0034CDF706